MFCLRKRGDYRHFSFCAFLDNKSQIPGTSRFSFSIDCFCYRDSDHFHQKKNNQSSLRSRFVAKWRSLTALMHTTISRWRSLTAHVHEYLTMAITDRSCAMDVVGVLGIVLLSHVTEPSFSKRFSFPKRSDRQRQTTREPSKNMLWDPAARGMLKK